MVSFDSPCMGLHRWSKSKFMHTVYNDSFGGVGHDGKGSDWHGALLQNLLRYKTQGKNTTNTQPPQDNTTTETHTTEHTHDTTTTKATTSKHPPTPKHSQTDICCRSLYTHTTKHPQTHTHTDSISKTYTKHHTDTTRHFHMDNCMHPSHPNRHMPKYSRLLHTRQLSHQHKTDSQYSLHNHLTGTKTH